MAVVVKAGELKGDGIDLHVEAELDLLTILPGEQRGRTGGKRDGSGLHFEMQKL